MVLKNYIIDLKAIVLSKLESFINHKGFVKYFKNTVWLMGEKIIRLLIGLLVGVWVARYLGPEQFGLLSYSISFVGLFAAIATFGLDGVVIRELVSDKSNRDTLLGTAFRMKLIGGLLVILILIIANFTFLNDDQSRYLILIIALANIFQSFNVISFYFQSQVISKYLAISNLLSLIIASIIKIGLILYQAPLISFAYVIVLESIFLAIHLIFYYRLKGLQIIKWQFNLTLAKSLLKDSWPLLLSGLVVSVYMKVDQVMIKGLLGPKYVGQYAAAVRVSEPWYFIPMVVASSLFPAIINAKKNDSKLYYNRLQSLYDLMVWTAMSIAIPMTFFSNWVINILFGSQYNQSASVLTIHIWTSVFVFLGVAYSKYLVVENLTKKSFYRSFMGVIINITLNYILIPIYGIQGAAVATLMGQFSANYLYDVFDKSQHHQLKMKTMSLFPVHLLIKNKN